MNDGGINKGGKIEISMTSFSANSENLSHPIQNVGFFQDQNNTEMKINDIENQASKMEDKIEHMTIDYDAKISKSSKNTKNEEKSMEKDSAKGSDKRNDKFQEFKELLSIIGATGTWRWEDAHRILQNDPRSRILKTIREQKEAFGDYIKEFKLKSKKELNEKRRHMRDEFIAMLQESKLLNSASKYYESAKYFITDSRFNALDEKTREEIFQDYLDDLEKEEREYLRETRSKRIQNLIALFEERKIPIEISYEECKKKLTDNQIFKSADEYEILTAFSEYMRNAEKVEYDERRKARRYNERKNRANFRELLSHCFKEKVFNIKTKWNELVNKISNDDRYLNLIGQIGSTPKELFDDFIQAEKENFKRQKGTIKQLLKNSGKPLNSSLSFEEFESMFNGNQEYLNIELENRKYLYEYVLSKIKKKEQRKERKANKLAIKFYKFLKKMPVINKNSKYQEFEAQIIQVQKFQAMSVAERQQLFNNYIQNTEEIKAKLKEEHIKRKIRKHGRSERSENSDEDQRKKKHLKTDRDKSYHESHHDSHHKEKN